MNNITLENKKTILYILLAFTFSVLMRMIWIIQFNGYEPFMFNGQFMINTNDGYYFAEGARDILSGVSQANDLSPTDWAASILTAFFAKVLPFSFESIILYMPVFLSSLVVIPIILIAKDLKNLEMGLIAALLASIAWSYYNRTMVGYYDTDMLNIVLPMFLLWSIIWAIDTKKEIYLLITAIDILIYRWWYPQSYSLEFSFFGLILLYTLIFDRKNIYNYKLLAIMMLAMINIDGIIRLPLVIVSFFVFKEEKFDKYIYYILGASIFAFFATGGFNPIIGKLNNYVFEESVKGSLEGMNLHFYGVFQTVREAGQIPFETFANRISGHTITFVLSVIGYIYLSYRHRIMFLAIPLVGLGFLASIGGLRFTIYAVPILAMGIAFLIVEISKQMPTQKLKYLSIVLMTMAILYPNYIHIDKYRVPTVFNADEVKILDELKSITNREDYVVSWWDYGYPIRYYSDVKTLVDGAKHDGAVNFPVSFILTNPPEVAAKMARLDVEYTENNFNKKRKFSNIEQMTVDYEFNDTNDFLYSLETDIELPTKTRDIYFYLPFKMLNIYPTVQRFSNMDLMTGEKYSSPLFLTSRNFKDSAKTLDFGRGIKLNKKDSKLTIGDKTLTINRFVKTYYTKNGELKKQIQNFDSYSKVNIIYMSNYNTFLIVDENTYNSTYVQLMVLEEYDKNLFEQVSLTPHAKVYKLKI